LLEVIERVTELQAEIGKNLPGAAYGTLAFTPWKIQVFSQQRDSVHRGQQALWAGRGL